jgi:hypothetical protein
MKSSLRVIKDIIACHRTEVFSEKVVLHKAKRSFP